MSLPSLDCDAGSPARLDHSGRFQGVSPAGAAGPSPAGASPAPPRAETRGLWPARSPCKSTRRPWDPCGLQPPPRARWESPPSQHRTG